MATIKLMKEERSRKTDINIKFKEFFYPFIITFGIMACLIYFGDKVLPNFMSGVWPFDQIYLEMSYNPFKAINAPFTYRVLTPLIVYLLPFEHLTGFIIVNIFFLFATSLLFFYYLRKSNFSFLVSIIGLFFFMLSPTTIFMMASICQVEVLMWFMLLLAFYAILCNNDKLYVLALLIGVMNKETVLIIIPLYFLNKLKSNGSLLHSIKSTIITALPALIAFMLIRLYFGLSGTYNSIPYYSIEFVKFILKEYLQLGVADPYYQLFGIHSPLCVPYFIYVTFGSLWLFMLFNLKHIDNNFLKNSLYLIPFIFLQLIIGIDIRRILFIAFPIIIPIALYEFEKVVSISKCKVLFTKSFIPLGLFLIIIFSRYFFVIVSVMGGNMESCLTKGAFLEFIVAIIILISIHKYFKFSEYKEVKD